MDANVQAQLLKIRNLLADKEMLIARANRELQQCGEWRSDWRAQIERISYKITEAFSDLENICAGGD